MAEYGMLVRWTGRDGRVNILRMGPYPTAQEAWDKALHHARALGWTPPKWWQWWRFGDYPRTDKFH
jgi:hypothetical protein